MTFCASSPAGVRVTPVCCCRNSVAPSSRLHVLEPFAQGGLGKVEFFRCAGQVAGVSQRQEDLQVFFVHVMFRPFRGISFSISFYRRKFKTVRTHLQRLEGIQQVGGELLAGSARPCRW